jgi:hypothetical protein
MQVTTTPQQEEKAPSFFDAAYDTVACWWVLLRAKILHRSESDPQVQHCLQLQRGTRFQLSGGEIHFLDSDE